MKLPYNKSTSPLTFQWLFIAICISGGYLRAQSISEKRQVDSLNFAADSIMALRLGDPSSLIDYAIELSNQLRYEKGLGEAYFNRAQYFRFQRFSYDSAIAWYTRALPLAEQAGDHFIQGRSLIGISSSLLGKSGQGSWQARSKNVEAYEVLMQGNELAHAYAFEMRGHQFFSDQRRDSALAYYQKAFDILKRHKKVFRQSYLTTIIIGNLISTSDTLAVRRYLQGQQMLVEQYPLDRLLFDYHDMYAQVHMAGGNYTEALKHLELANQHNNRLPIPALSASLNTNMNIARCYFRLNRIPEAIENCYRVIKNPLLKSAEWSAYQLLSEIYESTHQPDSALHYYKLYANGNSERLRQSSITLFHLEGAYQAQERLRENEKLKADAHVKNLLLASGVTIILVGGFFIVLIVRSRRRIRRINKELFAKNDEINAQNEEITLQAEQLQVKNIRLEEQNEMLEELNREKDGLVSIVAHDLRAPLNRVRGLAGLMNLKATAEDAELTQKMLQASDEGLSLIKDVLEVNKLRHDAITQETSYEQFSLKKILDDLVASEQRDNAGRKSITIVTAIDENLTMRANTTSVRRIFENLLSNAIKFSPPSSSIFIRATEVNNRFVVGVQDEGPGISREDQQKMFRKFQRLTAKPTGGESSTGLGLAIVKSLVEKLGGEITVESDLGVGTEFIVSLPKETNQNQRDL